MAEILATNPLPAHIRVSDARLPATYEQAKTALAQCSRASRGDLVGNAAHAQEIRRFIMWRKERGAA
jgi:hypothetical protein